MLYCHYKNRFFNFLKKFVNILISIIPVFVFLLLLLYFDSFKLVRPIILILCILWGLLSAGISWLLNTVLLEYLFVNLTDYSRYIAPVIEEILKILFIALLLYKGRIAFPIDAAILGFAVGAGFSLVENVYYLGEISSVDFILWLVRGLGTAVMHAGVTGIASILIVHYINKVQKFAIHAIIPGLLLSIFLHSVYNQFILPPLLNAMLYFIAIPILFIYIFIKTETKLRKWLDIEFSTEIELLSSIRSGKFKDTRAGLYFNSIKKRFSSEIIVDLLCYMDLHLELSIKAKSKLLMNEAGIISLKDSNISTKIIELNNLRNKIGKTSMFALYPILRLSHKELWKLSLLD